MTPFHRHCPVIAAFLLSGCFLDVRGNSAVENQDTAAPATFTITLPQEGPRGAVVLGFNEKQYSLHPGESISYTFSGSVSGGDIKVLNHHPLQFCRVQAAEVQPEESLVFPVHCEDKHIGWKLTDGTPDGTVAFPHDLRPVRDWFQRPVYFQDQVLLSGRTEDTGPDRHYWLFSGHASDVTRLNWDYDHFQAIASWGNTLYFLITPDGAPPSIQTMQPGADSPAHFFQLPELPEGAFYNEIAVINNQLQISVQASLQAKETESALDEFVSVALDGTMKITGPFKVYPKKSLQQNQAGQFTLVSWSTGTPPSSTGPGILISHGDGQPPQVLGLPQEDVTQIRVLGYTGTDLAIQVLFNVDKLNGEKPCQTLYLYSPDNRQLQEHFNFCENGYRLWEHNHHLTENSLHVIKRMEIPDQEHDALVPAIIPDIRQPDKFIRPEMDDIEGTPMHFRSVGNGAFLMTIEPLEEQPLAPWMYINRARFYAYNNAESVPLKLGDDFAITRFGLIWGALDGSTTIGHRLLFSLNMGDAPKARWTTDLTPGGTQLLK